MSSAYEPLGSLSLQALTKKTLFLVALAMAKRVGELQALSRQDSFRGEDMYVSYLPHLVTKTDRPAAPLPRSFKVCSLRGFAPLEEGSLLCPVRSLRAYLERTKTAVSRTSSLFVSPRSPSCQISKNALSFFLREVISGAGTVREVAGSSLRAHSICGVSTSTLFMQNWSVSKVLEAASWKSNSGFASFYLCDVQYIFEGMRSLGPFVSAGAVVNPT